MLSHTIINFLARRRKKEIEKWAKNPIRSQKKTLTKLIEAGEKTLFGKDHFFSQITTYEDYKKHVPISDYEGIKKYIKKIIEGHKNILWPGRPKYFAITSGTTSGAKYIPITKESLPSLMGGAKDALFVYIANTGNTKVLGGKHIFLQGSPVLKTIGGVKTGRLSGISAHHYPFYLNLSKLPSYKTNCIADWEKKVDKIVEETINKDMRILSGIPSWLQMYFEKLQEAANKPIAEIFKNFELLIYGGVSYAPYKNKFEKLIGKKVDSIEVYPASEGFFAFQNEQESEDLLLILNSGIFYEFIKEKDYLESKYNRLSLEEIEVGTNYVLIISTTAGLWGYNTGDTVRFTSTYPYKIVVTGRIKQFLSAFGEHIIVKEVEDAIEKTCKSTKIIINEFTVAPKFGIDRSTSFHEWFIDFESEEASTNQFAQILDKNLQDQNKYYKDLILGKVISPLKITKIKKHGFKKYMNSIGKLGGQNKIPKISNDRTIAEKLQKLNLII
tara:strand:+ start:1013 stop:2509 length:1497 start_codon:yes stop_codon:yes gene_type:complete